MTEKRGRGRPVKLDAKVAVSLRLSPDVLAAMRASGSGWQARADEALRAAFLAPVAPKVAAAPVPQKSPKPPAQAVAALVPVREIKGVQFGPTRQAYGSRLKPEKTKR